jgi:WD40 repeat protein
MKKVAVDSGKIMGVVASNIWSSVVIVGTTAKMIHAIDFYSRQKVLDIETKHERPIHTDIANYGGIYTSRAPQTLDLALTRAFDESFKLWDLRSAQCERTVAVGSRTVRVGCCFSPDSKFVALRTERLGSKYGISDRVNAWRNGKMIFAVLQ